MNTAQRLIQQLGDIQRTHGELWGIIVNKPLESPWCDPPIPTTTKAYDTWEGSVFCHVWTESSEYTNAMHDFGRLCPSLLDLAVSSRDNCDDSLKERIRTGADDDSKILRWLWFLSGFAVSRLPGRTPRTNQKCWGLNGHFFDADKLETQRKNLPAAIAANMPPDASCWLVRVENIIQASIEAVEYLANDSGKEYSNPLRFNTWFELFKDAKYSANESERAFRTWLTEQIHNENAKRDTPKGSICFDLNFLAEHGVDVPE
tara:strand:+ start:329 stop:1108 length:780 start_codon:yes stop_codon:yes gene_type:complete